MELTDIVAQVDHEIREADKRLHNLDRALESLRRVAAGFPAEGDELFGKDRERLTQLLTEILAERTTIELRYGQICGLDIDHIAAWEPTDSPMNGLMKRILDYTDAECVLASPGEVTFVAEWRRFTIFRRDDGCLDARTEDWNEIADEFVSDLFRIDEEGAW